MPRPTVTLSIRPPERMSLYNCPFAADAETSVPRTSTTPLSVCEPMWRPATKLCKSPLMSVNATTSRPACSVETLPRLVVVTMFAMRSPCEARIVPTGPLELMEPLTRSRAEIESMRPLGPVTSILVLAMRVPALMLLSGPEIAMLEDSIEVAAPSERSSPPMISLDLTLPRAEIDSMALSTSIVLRVMWRAEIEPRTLPVMSTTRSSISFAAVRFTTLPAALMMFCFNSRGPPRSVELRYPVATMFSARPITFSVDASKYPLLKFERR
jgi:hypothetical protein